MQSVHAHIPLLCTLLPCTSGTPDAVIQTAPQLPKLGHRKEALLLPTALTARGTSSCLLWAAVPHPADRRTKAATKSSP